MMHRKEVTRGAEENIKAQIANQPKASASPSNPAQAVREIAAVVKIWRTFPDMSEDDAKTFLSKANFDVQKATAAIQGRQPVILGDEASSDCSESPKPASASVKRGPNNIGSEVRAKSGKPPRPGMTQASRPRFAVKKKAPDLSTPHQEMVEITVGTENLQTFTVHKSFICHYSPYFETAFNNNQSLFTESKTQRMTLPDIAPDVFGLFVKWIYYKKVTDDNNKPPSNFQLVMLWIQGARFRTPGLQNIALRSLFGKSFCTEAPNFNFLYSNTRPGGALRRLFVDQVICGRMSYLNLSGLIKYHWNGMPQEMLQDAILGLKKALLRAAGNQPHELKVEDYLVPEEKAAAV